MSAASTRTHNTNTCTRQPTATERAGARAALRIRRATPSRCCRRLQGRSGERRRPLNDRRGDAVQGAAVARDKLSSAFLCTVTARQSRQRPARTASHSRRAATCVRALWPCRCCSESDGRCGGALTARANRDGHSTSSGALPLFVGVNEQRYLLHTTTQLKTPSGSCRGTLTLPSTDSPALL